MYSRDVILLGLFVYLGCARTAQKDNNGEIKEIHPTITTQKNDSTQQGFPQAGSIGAEPVPPIDDYESHAFFGAPASIGGHKLAPNDSTQQGIYEPHGYSYNYPGIGVEPVTPIDVYHSHASSGRPASIGGHKLAPNGHSMLWHVGVYSKRFTPYMQICGGTLVTTTAVISAAHCFWSDVERLVPAAADFAIGAGKRYRPWDNLRDYYTQTSDVAAIHIPVRYHDAATSYQEDIAVLLLAQEFRVSHAVRPACVDFNEDFDNQQLREGNVGTVLGWGLTKEDGDPSQILNYLELPAVSIEECVYNADAGFLRYITSDKICAGVTTGKALCRGDSGGGLVFTENAGSTPVPYLRGVASTAPRNEHRCNAYALAALTHVRLHRAFLRRYIPNLEDECKKHYPLANDLKLRYSSNDCETSQPIQVTCNCFC